MSFRSNAVKAALVVTGTLAMGTAPVQAAGITAGQVFSFGGAARVVDENAATTMLDFLSNVVPNPEGQATIVGGASNVGTDGQKFTLKDIPLVKTAAGWSLSGSVLNWIDSAPSLGFGYQLTQFDLAKDTRGFFTAVINGRFTPDDLATEYGQFSGQKRLAHLRGGSFSAELVAMAGGGTGNDDANQIPTPALLPGMFAIGLGMLRKRQAEANG
jgi:hypothetical protein